MRKWLLLVFACLPVCAWAQPESITIERQRDLAGLWKISLPAGFSVGLTGPARFGPMRDTYCRVTEARTIHCLSGGYAAEGTAVLDGDKVRIAWGSMMARIAIDAVYRDSGFVGTFVFRLSGFGHDAPSPSNGTRVVPPSDSDAASRYLASLMTQLAAGTVTAPHDTAAIKAKGGSLPASVAKLGAVEAVAFLGHAPRELERPEGELYSVHFIAFARGELICGLHQRTDGVLDAMRCV